MPVEFTLIFSGMIGTLLLESVYYLITAPCPTPHPLPHRWYDRHLGNLFYIIAYILALLRLPFALLPYLLKIVIFFAARLLYNRYWSSYPFQAIRLVGDFTQWIIVTWLVYLAPPQSEILLAGIRLVILAEGVRLATEKGQMVFSASWQMIPHRMIARWLLRRQAATYPNDENGHLLADYACYYALDDEARLQTILYSLKTSANHHPGLAARLDYLRAFRMVSQEHSLRCDDVREVASGTIYIHRHWTNDPWLLVGQALRRTPWMFDPRYLPRPFYYRSQSNRMATCFVLRHARWSWPYAWYQFGHEIKVARYDALFRLLRRFGIQCEEPVQADGRYRFDPLLRWLTGDDTPHHPLLTDNEVMADMEQRDNLPSAIEIAHQYVYPMKYVEEVLLPLIHESRRQINADRMASTVTSGASQ
ncbi:MAG: hypothetical protein K8I60_01740 [Anaerolineae bacterium]|nr:hypothetical protein [Anaerolineae bacterium]